ncbi:MAG TPA: acetyl/propionyl-CoA carboxylase subunit alpha, partial [Gammaproteobacteria bacterium]|nr:acetyl/propionyl-CoA carboxylase subunit alpha [Gammaproteobacteria bacterium]
LVTHGPDRDSAAKTMLRALDRFEIRGIQSNIPFLAALVQHPRFLSGDITTGFIEEEFPEGFAGNVLSETVVQRIVALIAVVHHNWHLREDISAGPVASPAVRRYIQVDTVQHEVTVTLEASRWRVTVDGQAISLEMAGGAFDAVIDFSADGIASTAQLNRTGSRYEVFHSGASVGALVLEPYSAALYPLMPRQVAPDLSHLALSPMPGLLVSVAVTEGDVVKAGDEIAVIEAMKMENVIRAERDGTVLCLHAKPGEALEVDQQVIEFVRETSA